MKPYSTHWADIAALRIVQARGDKPAYVVASGITPSGHIHVGNFREVITVDLVARALRSLGKTVRFIYSWDNFDTFRKVPKNLPDPQAFEPFLKQAIARIPDPWGEAPSFAQGRIAKFEAELKRMGVSPSYIYQEQKYAKGDYAHQIRHALERRSDIMEILNKHRTSPLPEDWVPTSIYCDACHKDVMEYERYDGEWNYSYRCASCQHEATVDIRQCNNLKLAWRVDWPMRWAYEQVDFEPGGKDHSSEGGSFDTGKEIVKKLWDVNAPEYLQYDFVMIKGGAGKMSSSSGELFTVSDLLQVYDPVILRWIFANQRPNHDFALSFDEDVIKVHDEFDRTEMQAYDTSDQSSKWLQARRSYELAQLSEKMPEKPPFRASFRELCMRLSICAHDIERTIARYYSKHLQDDRDREAFMIRAKCASRWLKEHAPAEFCYELYTTPVKVETSAKIHEALVAFVQFAKKGNWDQMSAKELNEALWAEVINKVGCDSKEFFTTVYRKFLGREQGPRLPSFLKELGEERVLELMGDIHA